MGEEPILDLAPNRFALPVKGGGHQGQGGRGVPDPQPLVLLFRQAAGPFERHLRSVGERHRDLAVGLVKIGPLRVGQLQALERGRRAASWRSVGQHPFLNGHEPGFGGRVEPADHHLTAVQIQGHLFTLRQVVALRFRELNRIQPGGRADSADTHDGNRFPHH